jgi:hypothetical protein
VGEEELSHWVKGERLDFMVGEEGLKGTHFLRRRSSAAHGSCRLWHVVQTSFRLVVLVLKLVVNMQLRRSLVKVKNFFPLLNSTPASDPMKLMDSGTRSERAMRLSQ